MKIFDDFSRKKKDAHSLSGEGLSVRDDGRPIHRDIGAKRKPVSLVSHDSLSRAGHAKPRNAKECIHALVQGMVRFFARMSAMQMITILCIGFLGFVVYGLGFVVRTENNIKAWVYDSPTEMIGQMWNRLNTLWRDYQIIGFIAENPIVPLEPFASYGRILSTLRSVSWRVDRILDLQPDILTWKNNADTQSIFPIMDRVFGQLASIDLLMQKAEPSFDRLMSANTSSGKLLAGYLVSFRSFVAHRDIWYSLLGKDGPTRILILNQNSDELRAGGGFPGTAFLLEFDQGKMIRSQFSDIYALDWQLRGYRPSPEGINRMRSIDYPGQPVEFEIRDANYYPAFSDSAKKIDELAQIAGIGKIDLVVGINQKLLEDIMQLTGPLSVEGVPVAFDHTNINTILSLLVEAKKIVTDTPKSTVKILSEELLENLHVSGKEKQALIIVIKHILSGEIVIGSPRADVQKAIDDTRLFDTWRLARTDWVYPIFTSISKNKSDRFMERTFEIYQTGQCERRVVLTQKHWFDSIEAAKVKKYTEQLWIEENLKTLFFVQGNGDNVQYLRYVLPPGTQLVDSYGIENPQMAESNDRYVVLGWYKTTGPSATSSASFTYRLDTEHCANATYFFKQPGLRNTRVIIKKEGKTVYQKFYE